MDSRTEQISWNTDMTLLKPTLMVNRLIVFKDTRKVFDVSFHKGVNILRGQNSSGKTTILDFLSYTLGAENIPWKQEALLCSESMAEISLNGKSITVRRIMTEAKQAPMGIFWGSIEEALKAPVHLWELFPFRRSSAKISFSQALFLALEMPEAKGDGAANLTMHQFLRVLYADQPSLHSPIFRLDSYDTILTRETVGNYLCGAYNDELYSAQLRQRELEASVLKINSELKSIFTVLGKSGQGVNIEWTASQIISLQQDEEALLKELSLIKRDHNLMETNEKQDNATDKLRKDLNEAKGVLNKASDRLATIQFQIQDSTRFIHEMRLRLKNLDESKATRGYFGGLSFNYCPSCLSELHPENLQPNQCGLCTTVLSEKTGEAQVLRMRNELNIQLKESDAIMKMRHEEAATLNSRLPQMKRELSRLEKEYSSAIDVWTPKWEEEFERISRRLGEIKQELKNLHDFQRLGSVIRELQNQSQSVQNELSDLNLKIMSMELAQEKRKEAVVEDISNTTARLLRKDLLRQAEFEAADDVRFSFIDNQVSVNGATKFSESSTVVLRHIFHLSMLSASQRKEYMRLPRFLVLDGIEDGGIELARGHRLQEIIVEECASFDNDFQLIFATSQIAPSLDIEQFVVGRSFSEAKRSLEISA